MNVGILNRQRESVIVTDITSLENIVAAGTAIMATIQDITAN